MCKELHPYEIAKTIADFSAPIITIGAGLLGLFTETHTEIPRVINNKEVKEKVLTKWAWVAMTGILIGGIISIMSLINDNRIDDIKKCLAEEEKSHQEREKFVQDSTYKANTDTIIYKSNQLVSNLLTSIGLTKQITNTTRKSSEELSKFKSTQIVANEASEYNWFINLASDIYIVSESSTFLNDAELDDSVDVVSAKFKTVVLDIDQKMKAGLQSPFLQRHKELRELWTIYSTQIDHISSEMYRIGELSQVDRSGWFDQVGRWGVAYEAMYIKIPEFRLLELKKSSNIKDERTIRVSVQPGPAVGAISSSSLSAVDPS